MPRRTQIYQKVPWTGGVNSSVNKGVLPANDLVLADNMEFTTTGTRKMRKGWEYYDTAIPTVTHRSSSGTTRTLVFSSSINIASPADAILVVGEKIKVASAGNSIYNTTAGIISAISTTTVTNDTIAYTFAGATSVAEGSTADTAATVTKNYDVLGVHDLWYYNSSNNAKAQERIAVTSQGLLFKFDANGRRTQITKSAAAATALVVTTLTTADLKTFANKLVWSMSGLGNTPKYYDPMVANEWKDLPGAPDFSIMQEHQGRLFADDKTDPDKLHFCAPFDETQWQGIGDSGAIYVGSGDGDPVGISAICPPFKGQLVVAKNTKIYRIVGEAPEEYFVDAMTNGVGAISHKAAVAFDMDDVFYVSRKGLHSIVATDQFGDFSGRFLSRRIQPTFNTWSLGRLRYMQGTYLPTINSVMWIVAEDGQTAANAIWLYNPTIPNEDGMDPGVWYRWPSMNAQSLCTVLQNSEVRPFAGNNAGRVMIGQSAEYNDYGTSGISFRAKSGTVYPDGNAQTIKAFKKFTLLYKPRSRSNFSVYFKVDELPPQTLVFSQDIQGDKLGEDFTLGSSIIGSDTILAPYTKDVYGHGRGCTIEVHQSGIDADVEIYGFMIEYESQDVADAVEDGGGD